MSHLRELSRDACLELLDRTTVGRVAVSTPDGPHVLPVNHAVVDDTLVIRTSAYSILGVHARGTILAFEVDEVDHAGRNGWSVVVRGRCAVESDPREIAQLRGMLPSPWPAGTRSLLLRLPLDEVTGRVVGDVPAVAAQAPARA